MNKKEVIGYYYEIHDDILTHYKVELSDFLGAKTELCFGRVAGESKLEVEESDDIIEQMLNQNTGEITEMNGNVATVMFKYPIPEDIFNKYYTGDKPIYKDESKSI